MWKFSLGRFDSIYKSANLNLPRANKICGIIWEISPLYFLDTFMRGNKHSLPYLRKKKMNKETQFLEVQVYVIISCFIFSLTCPRKLVQVRHPVQNVWLPSMIFWNYTLCRLLVNRNINRSHFCQNQLYNVLIRTYGSSPVNTTQTLLEEKYFKFPYFSLHLLQSTLKREKKLVWTSISLRLSRFSIPLEILTI